MLALALLLAAGASQFWVRNCLVGLEYRRRFSHTRVEFGSTVELEVEIVNRKILPLAWIEIEDEIPRGLPPERGQISPSHKAERARLVRVVALRPYERIRRRYRIVCNVRGEHSFGPVRLRSGDLFGLESRDETLDLVDVLVVYPRVVPVRTVNLPAQQPLGNRRTQSWLFEDPSRFVGVREYRPGDGLRRIHWAASARTQQLQVKVFEPTTSHKLMIFLNLRSVPGDWWGLEVDPDSLELAISTAASLATWAIGEGFQVGLATNGMHRMRWSQVAVDATADPGRLPVVLESLGRLQSFAVRPFEVTLADGARRVAFGATIVAVTAVVGEALAAELLALQRRGHPVALVLTGRQTTLPSLGGVVVRRVGPPAEWRTLPTLLLGVG
jgi:uncharacterized protein (DUF58 family)